MRGAGPGRLVAAMHNPVLRARTLVTLAALLAALAVSLFATAPRASAAQQACGYDGQTYYACLRFDPLPYLWWNGVAFLHVNLPQDYARVVLNCNPNFKATIWGDDDGEAGDDFIRNMVLDPAQPPTVDYAGILVSFTAPNLSNDQLDEDDGTDELYVKISYRDCYSGVTRTFKSSNYVASFTWG